MFNFIPILKDREREMTRRRRRAGEGECGEGDRAGPPRIQIIFSYFIHLLQQSEKHNCFKI